MVMRNEPKRTIFASGGFGLLQMVWKLGIERCASEDAGQGGWIVRSHIGWREERNIAYKSCGNLSLVDVF